MSWSRMGWENPIKTKRLDILGSNEELIKYTFTIYDLNDDGSLRFKSHQKNQFSVIMMIFSKDEMMTLLKDCIVQKDDG